MSKCTFECSRNKLWACCTCKAAKCSEPKCDMICLSEESEEEREIAQWYYENFVKPPNEKQ